MSAGAIFIIVVFGGMIIAAVVSDAKNKKGDKKDEE